MSHATPHVFTRTVASPVGPLFLAASAEVSVTENGR